MDHQNEIETELPSKFKKGLPDFNDHGLLHYDKLVQFKKNQERKMSHLSNEISTKM